MRQAIVQVSQFYGSVMLRGHSQNFPNLNWSIKKVSMIVVMIRIEQLHKREYLRFYHSNGPSFLIYI